MTLDQITAFFQWMTLINLGLIILTTILTITLRKTVCRMHGKLFGLDPEKIPLIMYAYLGVYRIFIIVFNLVPYAALLIIK